MKYILSADTDIGIAKRNNQDSLLYKYAMVDGKEVLMAIVCDGMGGLSKGELASASVILAFSTWFDKEMPQELKHQDMHVMGEIWTLKLKELNLKLGSYGKQNKLTLGTTFSGIFIIDDQYLIVHVGDTRIYYIDHALHQLTKDHTFIAREIARGTMTLEDAKVDRRRNVLLQCIGATGQIEPQISYGKVKNGIYMICSDGFRHQINTQEIQSAFQPSLMQTKDKMHQQSLKLIQQVKSRGEKDNISVILVNAGGV